MKKYLNYAFAGAIALTGAVGFASCSSSGEDVVGNTPVNNPTNIPEQEAVKTQFTISLPRNVARANTRQSDETVLQGTAFTGISGIKLIPYSSAPTGSSSLSSIMTLADITAFDYANSNTKVYSDVKFNVGVDHFVFYGTSIPPTSATDKFDKGSLSITNMSAENTLSSITFSLEQAYDATNEGVGTALIAALNAVADATPLESDGTTAATAEHTWDKNPGTDGVQYYKFSEVTSEMNSTLNTILNKFISLKVNSSNKVKLFLRDLYSNLDGLVTLSAFTSAPKAATMAMGIRKAIEAQFATPGSVATSELKAGLTGYPANCYIPDGAARVLWDNTTNRFVEANSIGGLNVAEKTNYVYPANLQYWVNSTIKTSNNVQSTNYSDKTWDAVKSLYTDGTSVGANTRSVLIDNPIQFAVASLETKVQLGSGVTTTLKDKENSDITIPTGGYTLTGVLVGNQTSVDWQFLPNGASYKTIYDKSVKSGIKTVTSATVSNYTLVLETSSNASINVALEFENSGDGATSFVGADGTVNVGDKFYLVTTLNPTSGNKVFTQDFTTTAVFSLPNDALKRAYNGLPDLRTPQMELGLSVDLTWQQGTIFNIDL